MPAALTGFFLSVFTEGWVVLAVMGVLIMLYEKKLSKQRSGNEWYYIPALFGSMLLFPFSLSHSMLTDGMLIASWVSLALSVAASSSIWNCFSGCLPVPVLQAKPY